MPESFFSILCFENDIELNRQEYIDAINEVFDSKG